MNRFHLYYTGTGLKPLADIARVRKIPGVQIVNDALPRSVVVDVTGSLAEQSLKSLSSWTLRQSHSVSLGATPAESSLNKAVPGLRVLVRA